MNNNDNNNDNDNDNGSVLDTILRQVAIMNIPPPRPIQYPPPKSSCCCAEDVKPQDHLTDVEPYFNIIPRRISEGFQGPDLRIDELSTIRRLLEQCTIDATRHEVIHVLETACSHSEECIGCSYKNSLGECNRNERIADILLNRFGRVK